MSKIAIIGGGAFGTALAAVLARAGNDVIQWMRDANAAQAINATHMNAARLDGVTLPDNLIATSDLGDIQNAQAVLLVLPAQQTHSWLSENHESIPNVPVLCCAKGIDRATGLFQSQIATQFCPAQNVGVLSGPGFATEIAQGMPTALTLGAQNIERARELQKMLSTDTLRLYATNDLLGVELGGAMKNIIAIGCGVAIGAGLGQSARAALLTRGFAEMVKLGMALGAKPETLGGLSGLGDLTLSATSKQSRNYEMGLSLGAGLGGDTGKTTEGAYSAKMAIDLAKQHGLELPVTATVGQLVEGEIDTRTAVKQLLNRPLGTEY